MRQLLLMVFMTFIWLALTMEFSLQNLIVGFIISYFIVWLINRRSHNKMYSRPIRFLIYILYFAKEVIKGSLKIGWDIITPSHNMNPAILAVPLDAKTNWEITLLANSITLTPGTTSLVVSKDRTKLYVYFVYVDEDPQKSIDAIKNGLEKKLLEVMR